MIDYSLITSPFFFFFGGGGIYPLFFRTPTLIPFVKWGKSSYDNQNHLSLLSFGNSWDTGGKGIIIGDNPAGHCFLLKDLIPMNFFK